MSYLQGLLNRDHFEKKQRLKCLLYSSIPAASRLQFIFCSLHSCSIFTGVYLVLLSFNGYCGSVRSYNQHFAVIISTLLDIKHNTHFLSSFFEYKTVPVILETEEGNLTVYTALPTNLRLHPTYSKVTI